MSESRRLFLAFILSIIVILMFQFFFPTPETPPRKVEDEVIKKEIQTETEKQTKEQEISVNKEILPQKKIHEQSTPQDYPQKNIQIDTPLYHATLDTLNGGFKTFYLKNYKYAIEQTVGVFDYISYVFKSIFNFSSSEVKFPVAPEVDVNRLVNMVDPKHFQPLQFFIDEKQENVMYQSSLENLQISENPGVIKFNGVLSSGLKIQKNIILTPDSYNVSIDITITNPSNQDVIIQPKFQLGVGNEPVEISPSDHFSKKGAIFETEEGFESFAEDSSWIPFMDPSFIEDYPKEGKPLEWIGVMDFYFITVAKTTNHSSKGIFTPIQSIYKEKTVQIPNVSLVSEKSILPAGEVWKENYQVYIGPKDRKEMVKFSPSLLESLDVIFGWIGDILMEILLWLQGYFGNFGISIIFLTIIVRIFLFPLAYTSMKSMKRMSKLTPKMKRIREKYADNRERLNQEMMGLYKKNKVNPASGCFPMLMQIPIFIALFSVLRPAIELRHTPFMLWIQDLSAADYTLILPILMGVTMFIQQKMTPMPTMDPNQAKMMKWFPIIMTFFFLNFQTGLVLYWVVSNTISIAQQAIFNRVKIKGVDVEAIDELIVCFAGIQRKDIEKKIKDKGGKVTNTISNTISHLVVKEIGNSPVKEKKATKLGIPILDIKQFEKFLKKIS